MGHLQVLERIRACGLVPAVRTREQVLSAIEALSEGGVSIAEVAMSMPGALGALELASGRFGERVLVGAGTILDAESARVSMLSGAQFIVSPIIDRLTIEMPEIRHRCFCRRIIPDRNHRRVGGGRRRGQSISRWARRGAFLHPGAQSPTAAG
ncbi:MAG: hypothetical protein JO159_19975 [Acidobacteria bacterium]|nr:hypothetical protein [Acidobacteriota bacterium]